MKMEATKNGIPRGMHLAELAMRPSPPPHWFPAKRCGWGWGAPALIAICFAEGEPPAWRWGA